jgi:hypothetical protein
MDEDIKIQKRKCTEPELVSENFIGLSLPLLGLDLQQLEFHGPILFSPNEPPYNQQQVIISLRSQLQSAPKS